MSIISIIFSIFQWLPILVLSFVCYKAYEFVYLPWKVRQKYKGFQNVAMEKDFVPVLGDIKRIEGYVKENKYKLQHFIDIPIEHPDKDFYINQLGSYTLFEVVSTQSQDEFEQLIPAKIDRHNCIGFPLSNMGSGAFPLIESNKNWNERRTTVMKTIGINQASKFIPMMIDIADEWIANIKKNEIIDLTIETKRITFRIISKILFGTDIDKMEKSVYIDPNNGEMSQLSFEECYFKYSKDEIETFYLPINRIFPFLSRYNLVNPFKRNRLNNISLKNSLRSFLTRSTDTTSVYMQVKSSGRFNSEDVLLDMLGLLFAGFDTSSYGLSSLLYNLKKYPSAMEKLKSELSRYNLVDPDIKDVNSLKENYENCDYLNYIIKEGLRIDPPGPTSIFYISKEDVTICGVPFSKGSIFTINTTFAHFNSNQWQKSREFIPERFDPESEYYYKPSNDRKKDMRHPKSFIPFTFGPRNCAGQSLAKLELRVIISRLITKIEYEISEDLLNNDYVKFNMFSNFRLYGKLH